MKLWNYIILSVILTILLEIGGVGVTQSVSDLIGLNINLISETGTLDYSVLWSPLLLLLAGATLAGIAIGFFTKSPTEKTIMIPFIIYSAILFITTFVGVIVSPSINGWVFWVVFTIFSALIIGFIVSIFEWYAGGGD